MENQTQVLAQLQKGNKVATKTSREEMAIINLLVANGYGSDYTKEVVTDGVYIWSITSLVSSIKEAVSALQAAGITVHTSTSNSPFANYSNTEYFVMASDLEGKDVSKFNFKENFLRRDRQDVPIMNVLPMAVTA